MKTAKKAFRFPKTFTANVTKAVYDASTKRKTAGKNWALLNDCPVAVAAHRALKLKRYAVSVSRVDCAIVSPTGKSRRYTHDGVAVVKAFDERSGHSVTLPRTVTFTLTKMTVAGF